MRESIIQVSDRTYHVPHISSLLAGCLSCQGLLTPSCSWHLGTSAMTYVAQFEPREMSEGGTTPIP